MDTREDGDPSGSSALSSTRTPGTLFSGGAPGADSWWLELAAKAGFDVVVCSFRGHKHVIPRSIDPRKVLCLAVMEDRLSKYDELVRDAAYCLGKNEPTDAYTKNLMRRNAMIAESAETMLAVGVVQTYQPTPGHVGVAGGTGWTCQMFAIRESRKAGLTSSFSEDIPLFVLCIHSLKWYRARIVVDSGRLVEVCWSAASPPSISASSGASVAGIGSRDCESLEPDQRERLREAMMAVFAERSG